LESSLPKRMGRESIGHLCQCYEQGLSNGLVVRMIPAWATLALLRHRSVLCIHAIIENFRSGRCAVYRILSRQVR
jgi:hypothetical protein